jgi:DNA processing protein
MNRDRLDLAVAAQAMGTASSVVAALRLGGLAELERRRAELNPDSRARIEAEANEFDREGVEVVFLGEAGYPSRLAEIAGAPPLLYYRGNQMLFEEPSVAMCGSRDASPEGLEAAWFAGQTVATAGLTIVSGNARGVDTATHTAALAAGGNTIIVLAEGITGFRMKRALVDAGPDPDRVLVVSQFPPRQRWTVPAAMTRNAVIAGLGLALVVIEAGETGGTLDAGLKGLELGRPVLALGFRSGHRAGNSILLGKGAKPVASTGELRDAIEGIRRAAVDQLGMFEAAATPIGQGVRNST